MLDAMEFFITQPAIHAFPAFGLRVGRSVIPERQRPVGPRFALDSRLAGIVLSCTLLPLRNRRHANRGCVVLSRRSDGIAGQIANQFRQTFFKTEERLKVLPDLLHTLQDVYQTKLQPLEEHLHFQRFYDTAELSAAYFTAKPMVLVLG